MRYDTSKKRSIRDLNRSITNCTNANHHYTKSANRSLFSVTFLALATLANVDYAAVFAFTPTTAGKASFSKGTLNKDNLATKIYPSSNHQRRGQRRHVASTVVDDDSATKASSASTPLVGDSASVDHGVSIMTSPILNQQRRSRLSAACNAAENLAAIEDEYFHHSAKNNQRKPIKNQLPLQVVINNDIASLSSKRPNQRTRNQNTTMARPKRRINSPQRKKLLQKKKGTKPKKFASSLLSLDEERKITYKIRDLRRVNAIRDELIAEKEEWPACHPAFGHDDVDNHFPTEDDWAKACDLDVLELRKIMSEGQDARSLLVSANVGLVTSIAKRHYHVLKQMTNADGGVGTILTLQDMIQEGNLGLMKAAERFEPERGWRFSTYATYWIRQRILQSITDTARVIRLPAHGTLKYACFNVTSHEIEYISGILTFVHSFFKLTTNTVTATLQKLNKARKDMSVEIGRMPSDAELADHLKMSVDKLRKINEKARSVVSLESPLRMGSNHKAEADRRTIGDFIASDAPTPEEDAQQKSLQRDIRAVVNELADREREVLILRYGLDNGEPMSTSQTAAHLGITTDRVRYVETRALNKLRSPQRNYRLKDYLGEGYHTAIEEKVKSKISVSTMQKTNSKRGHEKKQRTPTTQDKFWFF